jgi:exonuclease V gamma subunit
VYNKGLSSPVHLFPKTSFAYAEQYADKGDTNAGLNKAKKVWIPDNFRKGRCDSDDPYHFLSFGNAPGYADGEFLVNEEFTETASRVYGPLLAAREEING